MFDTLSTLDPAPAARAGVLDAATVGRWKDGLVAALELPSGLDDAGCVDAIRALEELTCAATAAQAQLARELDASQRVAQAAAGVPAARLGHGVAAQVALARRESPHRGQRHLGLAKVVATELPCTWSAWSTGRITEWKATLIARETACLSLPDRLEVDRLLAGDADRLEAMGERQLEAAVRAEATRLDPAAEVKRRRRAESERHVSLRPAPDTMTWLTALLPVKDGVSVHAQLTLVAAAARAAGDERSKGQVMADALVAAVIGAESDTGTPDDADQSSTRPAEPRVALDLVMTDATLFGTSVEPAHLDAFGPIPAELARELVAAACSRDEELWIRRLYAAPTSGELVSMDSTARLFRNGLARFIRLRDRLCRTPWCDAPIRHVDHVLDHVDGGPTTAANAQGLCEACNYAKQAPGWRARPGPPGGGHVVEHSTPTGHRYRSRPPVVATVWRRPLRMDFVLTG